MSALIEFEEVCKYYQMGDTTVKAADHITMKIDKGEFVAIVGQSGSGKSTCMNIIGCLDVPTSISSSTRFLMSDFFHLLTFNPNAMLSYTVIYLKSA